MLDHSFTLNISPELHDQGHELSCILQHSTSYPGLSTLHQLLTATAVYPAFTGSPSPTPTLLNSPSPSPETPPTKIVLVPSQTTPVPLQNKAKLSLHVQKLLAVVQQRQNTVSRGSSKARPTTPALYSPILLVLNRSSAVQELQRTVLRLRGGANLQPRASVLRLRGGANLRPRAYPGGPVALPAAPVAVGTKTSCKKRGDRRRRKRMPQRGRRRGVQSNADAGDANHGAAGADDGPGEDGGRYHDTEGEDEAPEDDEFDHTAPVDSSTSHQRQRQNAGAKPPWRSDGALNRITPFAGQLLSKLADSDNSQYVACLDRFCLKFREETLLLPKPLSLGHSLQALGDRIIFLQETKASVDFCLMLTYVELVLAVDKYVLI